MVTKQNSAAQQELQGQLNQLKEAREKKKRLEARNGEGKSHR